MWQKTASFLYNLLVSMKFSTQMISATDGAHKQKPKS